MKISRAPLLLVILPVWVHANEAAWQVVQGEQGECILTSKSYDAFDGYEPTKLRLTISSEDILISTRSTIDSEYQQTGIKVDAFDREPFDHVVGETAVKFVSTYPKLLDQFKQGVVADVALGYWPTWPQTDLQHLPVDLIGFTDAFNEFVACNEPTE